MLSSFDPGRFRIFKDGTPEDGVQAGISGNLTSGYPREEVPGQWLDAEDLDSFERAQVALSWTGACDIVRRE